MKTYTIEQFKAYLMQCDSLGDAVYFLSDEKMEEVLTVVDPRDPTDLYNAEDNA